MVDWAESQVLLKLTELARDPTAFNSVMNRAFSGKTAAVESLRQRILLKDFSWLPATRLVSNETLRGALGAYDAVGRQVFLNEAVLDNERVQRALTEELGHHLDTMLSSIDTPGDEGEMFRRLVFGLKPRQSPHKNEEGTIFVDGEEIAVEFWWGGDAWRWTKRQVEKAKDFVVENKEYIPIAIEVGKKAIEIIG
jgi:hypothetical protein